VAFRDSATSDGAGGTPTASEKRTEHFQKEVKNLKSVQPHDNEKPKFHTCILFKFENLHNKIITHVSIVKLTFKVLEVLI
jgi:hypothetical protein